MAPRSDDNLPPDHFRVISTLKERDGQVYCSLATLPFTASDTYDALSYVWGHQRSTPIIWNGNYAIKITPDLMKTLTHLYESKAHLGISRLLIDTICIHQSDNEEKLVQSGRKRDLYHGAARVLVRLGTGSELSGDRLQKMSKVTETMEEIGRPIFDEPIRSLRLPEKRDPAGERWEISTAIYSSPVCGQCRKLHLLVISRFCMASRGFR